MHRVIIILLTALAINVIATATTNAECSPIHVFTGEFAGDEFGRSVASAGDVNNDGFADLIVGAPLNDAGGEDAGRAYVFSGLDGDTLYVFTGAAEFDNFGWSVASAGDVNDDGYDDLIVGAYLNDAGGMFTGRAYVFSGLSGDTLFIFTGEAAGDKFGFSVAPAGDVNHDSHEDLLVGSILNDAGGLNAGRAYVFSGLNGDILHVFTGDSTNVWFGQSVAPAGDVNNDGYADLIIGANQNNVDSIVDGKAYVFSGLNGDRLHVFDGIVPFNGLSNFGGTVASAGDVNNDGFADLIVGDNFYDGNKLMGRAYVFSGLNGDTLYVFTGEGNLDQFGVSVSSAGDVNKDGFADLIVGAWLNDAGGEKAGRAYMFSGQDGDSLLVLTGNADFDLFGRSVASAGDVNRDGFIDLIIGAPGNVDVNPDAGKVYVYSGAPDRSCCLDVTGNVDGGPGDIVDIADLTILIDHLFINFTPLLCPAEGNIDGDSLNVVDIADLTALIDHLFITFPPTAGCQ